MTDQPVEIREQSLAEIIGEERQPVDARVELANMLSIVNNSIDITREQHEAIGKYLEGFWLNAQAANDQQLMTEISDTWNRINTIAEENAALAFQVTALGNMTVSALEGERATRQALDSKQSELDDIHNALEAGDEEHPRLRDFASDIRDDAAMDLAVDWEAALESNYDQFRHDLIKRIQSLTWYRCDVYVATQFVDVLLQGVGTPSDLQREMLSELVGSFAREVVQYGH
jgi:hypothetical protein